MEKILVILNPAARSERAGGTWEKIRDLPAATVQTTSAPGDARSIAEWAVAQGFATVVAAGGDGTINEVVNGIAGSDIALGILPVGTMNVFAAELSIPNNLPKAWEIIQARHTRRIDLVRANDQYFVQLAGVGLDAQVVQATSRSFKKNFGPLSYLISAAQIALRAPPKLIVEHDGIRREGSFVLIGNGRYYGGPVTFFKIQLPIVMFFSIKAFYAFYIQHQHEHAQKKWKNEWNHAISAIKGSTYWKLPRVFQWLTGNIGIHHIHHLSSLIPNYNLQRCKDENPVLQEHVTIVSFTGSMKYFLNKLWDEQQERMITFREYRQLYGSTWA